MQGPEEQSELVFGCNETSYYQAHLRRPSSARRRIFGAILLAPILLTGVILTVWGWGWVGERIWPRDPDLDWKELHYRTIAEGQGSSILYYTGRVMEEEAKQLGSLLQSEHFFDHPCHVVFSRRSEGYVVSLFMKDRPTREILHALQDLRQRIARELFNQQPVLLELCDPEVDIKPGRVQFRVQRTLR